MTGSSPRQCQTHNAPLTRGARRRGKPETMIDSEEVMMYRVYGLRGDREERWIKVKKRGEGLNEQRGTHMRWMLNLKNIIFVVGKHFLIVCLGVKWPQDEQSVWANDYTCGYLIFLTFHSMAAFLWPILPSLSNLPTQCFLLKAISVILFAFHLIHPPPTPFPVIADLSGFSD